jgi:O-acetyl-ADP-ribose deacetylase (regulator of RNase III)
MIHFLTGNLLDDDADALVNPVNCDGVSGKGLALEFKKRFPENFKSYKYLCVKGNLDPGSVRTHVERKGEKFIFVVNFAMKDNWSDPSKIEWIKEGLDELFDTIVICEVKSIAIPALGCGEGGLRWEDVKPLIIATAEKLPHVEFRIYEPR